MAHDIETILITADTLKKFIFGERRAIVRRGETKKRVGEMLCYHTGESEDGVLNGEYVLLKITDIQDINIGEINSQVLSVNVEHTNHNYDVCLGVDV